MFRFLNSLATWWNGATIGTLVTIWRRGVFVGEDAFGNRYYQSRDGKRRWVIFKGLAEPSKVPPDWHGWLHHTFEHPPTVEPFKSKPWEKTHEPNLTGTDQAYRPKGSLAGQAQRAPATGDYEAWQPE